MKERPILFSGPMVRAGRYPVHKHNEERKCRLPGEQVEALYRAGSTIAEIAQRFEVSKTPIRRILRERRVPRRAAKPRQGRGAGAENPAWKGGRRVRTDGYVMVWTPEGDVLEHRLVMSQVLGRALRPDEVVHHRDGDKQNNHPSNLEVMSQSDHAALHAPDMHAARYGRG